MKSIVQLNQDPEQRNAKLIPYVYSIQELNEIINKHDIASKEIYEKR